MPHWATAPDGVPIAYDTQGAGEPALVFVHGWSCDRTYWRSQVGAFSDRHLVVAIDLAGHGDSGVDRGDWTMAAFGDDVVAVVDELGLDRLVLVGHSMGGDVITEAAVRLAPRVGGLVWVDTYSELGDASSADEVAAFVAPFRTDFVGRTRAFVRSLNNSSTDPALVDWIADDMSAAPPSIAIETMTHSIANDGPILDLLGRLDVPVVAINPEPPSTDVASMNRYGIRVVTMADVGHFVMLEAPDRFNAVLGEVLTTFR